MSAKRSAYCTGCGVTFMKMHVMINHRRTDRCGGRFLPIAERHMVNMLRLEREAQDRFLREEQHYAETFKRTGDIP